MNELLPIATDFGASFRFWFVQQSASLLSSVALAAVVAAALFGLVLLYVWVDHAIHHGTHERRYDPLTKSYRWHKK